MYRNFYGDQWSNFKTATEGKRIFLFGWESGKNILLMMRRLACPWNMVAVLDNDRDKWGLVRIPHTDECIDVISPEKLKNETNKNDIIVLICGKHISEMAEQLEGMGIKNYYSEFWMSLANNSRHYHHIIDENIVYNLKNIMDDDESRDIIDKIVKKRKEGFADYSDIFTRGSEYFRDEFWTPEKDGVFIDAGGADGDTIEEYNCWTKGEFNHIYTFEAQSNMADIIESKLWKWGEKVTLIRKGLWSQRQILKFENGDDAFSGKISENGQGVVETVSLDEEIDEKVSFIKMDIEGAEMKAIKGAENIICRDKPKLALSIYHLQNDLFEIPFFIHELVPEYRLSIRHFDVTCSGTVLFARI